MVETEFEWGETRNKVGEQSKDCNITCEGGGMDPMDMERHSI